MNQILVHFRGPLLTLSGYGTFSRQIVDYLLSDERFVVFVEGCNWGNTGFIHENLLQDKTKLSKYYEAMARYEQYKDKIQFNISIQCTIPNEFQRRAEFNIIATAGIEVNQCSQNWIQKCNEADLVIVPSDFSKKILGGTVFVAQNEQTGETTENRIAKPILVMPHWFDRPETIKPLDVSFDTPRNLLFVGLWGGKGSFGEDRKNVADLIRLFYSTFKEENVGLVLKAQVVNGCSEDKINFIKRLNDIKTGFPKAQCKIHLIHEDLTEEQMWGLYSHKQIDGMVSLTHGEGFGIPLLEAHAAGLPVIATNWSGHLMFLREKNGYIPIAHEMIDIPDCQLWDNIIEKNPDGTKPKWAKPDYEEFQKKIRKFVNSPHPIKKAAKDNVAWLDEKFSKSTLMAKWKELFDKILGQNQSNDGQNEQDSAPILTQKQMMINELKKLVEPSDRPKALYVMPQAAGDVLISTAIVDSLIINRHLDQESETLKSNVDWYFATSEPFKPLLEDLVERYGVKVIDFKQELMLAELTREVWDYVYVPGVNIQFNFSNWLVGNGEYALRLLEETAKNCNLSPYELTKYRVKTKECSLPKRSYVVVGPGGIKGSKLYRYWDDVIMNIKEMLSGVDIVQVGMKNEPLIDGCLDYRGKEFAETFFILKHALFFVGCDSFPAHAAAAMECPHLVIYASTHANTCSPVCLGTKVPQVFIEARDDEGNPVCWPKCYKDECQCIDQDTGKNCVSQITPEGICAGIRTLYNLIHKEEMIANFKHPLEDITDHITMHGKL